MDANSPLPSAMLELAAVVIAVDDDDGGRGAVMIAVTCDGEGADDAVAAAGVADGGNASARISDCVLPRTAAIPEAVSTLYSSSVCLTCILCKNREHQ